MDRYLDTETTGLDPATDEIVEIAIVGGQGEVLFHSLVRPVRQTSWPEAEEIHGISPAMVADAPTLDEIREELRAVVRGHDLIIYNAAFDIAFLPDLEPAAVHCCMLAFAEDYGEWSDYWQGWRWQKLAFAAWHVMHDEAVNHRALGDARAARMVWKFLRDPEERRRIEAIREDRRIQDLAEFHLRQGQWEEERRSRNFSEFMSAFWQRWWLRMPMETHWARSAWRERIEPAEIYAQLFFGRSLAFLDAEPRYEKIFQKRSEVPADLWPAGRFPKYQWYRDELEPSGNGYIHGGMIHPLYHASEKERIDAEFSLRLKEEQPVYWSSDLRKLGYSKAQIQSMTPYAERLGRLSGRWYYVYLKSDVDMIQPARPPRSATLEAGQEAGSVPAGNFHAPGQILA